MEMSWEVDLLLYSLMFTLRELSGVRLSEALWLGAMGSVPKALVQP